MTKDNGTETSSSSWNTVRRRELAAFFVLAFGIWPIVAVGLVGAFGFSVWMWQIVFGPPGPPPNGLH